MFRLTRGLLVIIVVLNVTQLCSAGLINYERRDRRAAMKAGAPSPAAPVASGTQAQAQTENTTALNQAESQYDLNGDKTLQPAELTAYLKAVIQKVDEGEDVLAEGVLQKYDGNKDGKITYSEMLRIRDEIK